MDPSSHSCPIPDIEEVVKVRARNDSSANVSSLKKDPSSDVYSLVFRKTAGHSLPNQRLSGSTTSVEFALCACQQSSSYPFCDGTHKSLNQQWNTNISPIYTRITVSSDKVPTPSCCQGCSCSYDSSQPLLDTTTTQPSNITPTTLHQSPPRLLASSAPAVYRSVDPLPPISSQPPTISATTSSPSPTPEICAPSLLSPSNIREVDRGASLDNNLDYDAPSPPARPKIIPGNHNSKLLQQNIFDWDEISLHNTPEDCWMVFNGSVYNVTEYFPHHPGGRRALTKFAGKDGSENIQFHSKTMTSILNSSYFIGKVKSDPMQSSFRCIIS